MAGKFLDVVKGLWAGWADNAIVADRTSGLYIDPTPLREDRHLLCRLPQSGRAFPCLPVTVNRP
jgi:hypothetical protein